VDFDSAIRHRYRRSKVAFADYKEANPTGVPTDLAKADIVKRVEYLAKLRTVWFPLKPGEAPKLRGPLNPREPCAPLKPRTAPKLREPCAPLKPRTAPKLREPLELWEPLIWDDRNKSA